MILLGCLLAFSAAVAPRLVLILAWIFSDRWDAVWQGEWIWPLLGIILLPYTTIMYLLAWNPAGPGGSSIEGWDWMFIIMGLFLDLWKWSQIIANRREAQTQTMKYYPTSAPSYGSAAATDAAIASGQVPPITSPTAVDSDYAPTATTPVEEVEVVADAPAADAAEQLAKLDQLRESGALTDEEYEAAKAKL